MDAGVLGQDRAAEKDPAQRVVARPQRTGLDRRASPAGDADADQGPAVREDADAVDEVLAADRIDDDVHATRVGQLIAAIDEAAGRVVDPMIEPERLQSF